MVTGPRSAKGLQTQRALQDAARRLFTERGYQATTVVQITEEVGRSPAVFYRYFYDKEELLATLAETFLSEVLIPRGSLVRLPESADDAEPFRYMVTAYWKTFKPQIGVVAAVSQLAATQPRFALLQSRMRQFGMDVVTASVLRAQEQGYGTSLNPCHIAVAIALLFEQFTAEILRPDSCALQPRISDQEAIVTLATIWKTTLYGFYEVADDAQESWEGRRRGSR